MKKIFFAFLLLLLFFTSALSVFCFRNINNNKIGFVDIVRVLNSSNDFKKISKEVEVNEGILKAKSDTIYTELQKNIKDLEKNKFTQEEKNALLERFNLKQSQYKRFLDSEMARLKKSQIDLTQKLINKINRLTQAYAVKNNYALIVGANGSGNVIYGSKKVDLTEFLMDEVNK